MAVRKVLDMLRVSTALGEVQTARLYLLKAINALERGKGRNEGMIGRIEGLIGELDGIGADLTKDSFDSVDIDIEKVLREADPKAKK